MNAKSFLIIQTAFLGDVILATAIVEALHHSYPEAKIDFLLRKGNQGLLNKHPFIHRIYIWNKKEKKYKDYLRILRAIRAEQYDVLINLQRFTSSGLLTLFSKARHTIGFDKNPLSRFFSVCIPHKFGEDIHEVARNLSTLAHFIDHPVAKPKLYPSLADYERVSSFQKSPYICIAPASVWFTKQLPTSKWIELINTIPSSYVVYLIGGSADQALCDHISTSTHHPNAQVLAGQLSLLASAALMEKAQMNYVNDSAPLHIASSMNAPVTAFFCSTIPSFGFGPLSDISIVVETNQVLACRPCDLHGKKSCPQKHFKCGHQIQLPKMLANSDPSSIPDSY